MKCMMMGAALVVAGVLNAAPFADGDRVAFWGDSITHGGTYVQMLADFYLTRYPDRNVRLYNAGVSGDNAGAAMTRFKDDILRHDPTVVAFMFGMNDSWRDMYDPKQMANAAYLVRLPERERACFERYATNMTRLAERVKAEIPKARLMFLTPTPYDETAVATATRKTPALRGTGAVLANFADFDRRLAKKMGGEVVEWYASVQALVNARQMQNPDFSFVRTDRVHPDAPGHLFMTYEFLKAQGVSGVVSDVAVSAADGRVARSANATVSAFEKTADGCAFTVLERALPWPIVKGAEPALEWAPILETLNRETLAVADLEKGARYALSIDGENVGAWTAEAFAKGVELGRNEKTPQFRQAAEVGRLNADRCGIERDKLRMYAAVRWILPHFKVTNPDDLVAVQRCYDNLSESARQGYFERLFPWYVKEYDKKAEYERDQETRWTQLLTLRTPRPHRYALRLVKSGPTH